MLTHSEYPSIFRMPPLCDDFIAAHNSNVIIVRIISQYSYYLFQTSHIVSTNICSYTKSTILLKYMKNLDKIQIWK